MLSRALLFVAAVLALACGGRSLTSPTPASTPPPTVVVDGLTGEPVAAAVERVDGRLLVSAPGYLQRDQRAAATVFLWPAPDPEYVRTIVYAVDGVAHPLARWAPAVPFRHCLGADVNAAIVSAVADILSRVSGIPQTAAGPCTVQWTIDRTRAVGDGQRAFCAPVYEGRSIVGAELVFKDSGSLAFAALHEAGHALGLGHSNRREDIMWPTGGASADRLSFSPAELDQLTMIYRHRLAGNEFPDREAP